MPHTVAAHAASKWGSSPARPRALRSREEYTGPLLALVWRSMPDLGPSFEQFALGLEARAEEAR